MVKQSGQRAFILDTSILVHDPNCIEAFPDDTIIIPSWVLDQLDGLKRNAGELGAHSRQASRIIHEYSLDKGFPDEVRLKSGGLLKACTSCDTPLGIELSAHNQTIALARRLKSEFTDVAVLSKDPNLRIKARMQGVRSVDYERDRGAHDPYSLFPGCFQIVLDRRNPIDELHRTHWVDIEDIVRATDLTLDDLIPNQCVIFTFDDKDTLAVYKKNDGQFRLVPKPKVNGNGDKSKGIQPNNCEQAFAYSLLMDPKIDLVALVGSAGPGKTLMSLLAGYRQLKNDFERGAKPSNGLSQGAAYNKIIVFRPTVERGRPLGFLPGTLEEKIEPWMFPIIDNMELILEHSGMDSKGAQKCDPLFDLIDRGILQILPINHIRGRSIHDAFIIIDEAQNFTREDLRALLTRPGKGTKVVLTGDISQIDDPYMDEYSNGFSHVISAFMGQECFGYTIMTKGEERSLLAKLSAELV